MRIVSFPALDALAIAVAPQVNDQPVKGFVDIHCAGLDELKTRGGSGEKGKAGIDALVDKTRSVHSSPHA
jgi:hypothetical protein